MPKMDTYTNLSVNKDRSDRLRGDFKKLGLPGTFVTFALDSTEQNLKMISQIKKNYPDHDFVRNEDEVILLNRKNNTYVPLTKLFLEFLEKKIQSV
jgi:hypothetical protein